VDRVDVLTGLASAGPLGQVGVRHIFDADRPATCWRLLDSIAKTRPGWVVLQYNPFSYGRRGLNLHLPRVMSAIRRQSPGTRLAVMFHEQFVPITNWRFAVMTTWQRWQFRQLGRAADLLYCSMSTYADRCRRWFLDKTVVHLPVGSNVPRVNLGADEARRRLGIDPEEIVLGVFGTAHVSRSFSSLAAAADAVRRAGGRPRVLYIGAGGAAVKAALAAMDRSTAITDGPLSAEEVSRRLSAVDIYLSTYTDGISTRRGAMMAALEHGLCVVGTYGYDTDPELRAMDGHAILLTPAGDEGQLAAVVERLTCDPAERQRLGRAAQAQFEQRYSWSTIAKLMVSHLC
jgi:glycosyltransferase involved in cell wall biosynthesis